MCEFRTYFCNFCIYTCNYIEPNHPIITAKSNIVVTRCVRHMTLSEKLKNKGFKWIHSSGEFIHTKRRGLCPWTSLIPPPFNWSVCTNLAKYRFFLSFYGFSVRFWNCSVIVFFIFRLMSSPYSLVGKIVFKFWNLPSSIFFSWETVFKFWSWGFIL